jgi:hypothetical protein
MNRQWVSGPRDKGIGFHIVASKGGSLITDVIKEEVGRAKGVAVFKVIGNVMVMAKVETFCAIHLKMWWQKLMHD